MPGQGSLHLFCIHASVGLQSVLRTHSGRHPSYGSPTKFSSHLHDPTPFFSAHFALSPQGSQGELYSITDSKNNIT